MARFSVGGEGDQGTSSQRSKRQRLLASCQQRVEEDKDEELENQTDESEEDDYGDDDDDDEEEGEEGDEEDEEEEGEAGAESNQITTLEPRSSSNVPVPASAPVPVGRTGNGGIYVTLTDPEVLDCPVCFESLTIPVYQCENGHTACSSCCQKLAHKCPACSLPIGYNRCRAIERVLESVKLTCPNLMYGCKEMIIYSKKFEHEKVCAHAPCVCPLPWCKFDGSSKQIYQHFSNKHKGTAVQFRYDNTFPVFFTLTDKSRFLQEEKEGIIFILSNSVEILGNIITVSCIAPSSNRGYFYELTAKMEGSNLRFQSFTKNIQKANDDNPRSEEFLVVPSSFFGSYGQINCDLCIWRYGTHPANIQRSSFTNAQRSTVLNIQRSTGVNVRRSTSAV